MCRRSAATIAHLHVNLEGHTSQVSSASADFLISGSVAAVINQAVAMSSEPNGHELTFPSVNMPSVAALLAFSEPAPAAPVDVPTAQSSSRIVGFGPPLLTVLWMQDLVVCLKQLVSLLPSSKWLARLCGGSVRSRPLSHAAPLNPNFMLLRKFRSLSSAPRADGRCWFALFHRHCCRRRQ
jgi:hypothetical protein